MVLVLKINEVPRSPALGFSFRVFVGKQNGVNCLIEQWRFFRWNVDRPALKVVYLLVFQILD